MANLLEAGQAGLAAGRACRPRRGLNARRVWSNAAERWSVGRLS
ncbi:hypothetical protein ABK905_17600 [Acerihabitans sp. KWT182]|uniref:Uncharacterized protein n=1 Tax=Acerihabitans sp. KWT182 TaxID=3157919 RepID=A0AAU7Q626_9GAMM